MNALETSITNKILTDIDAATSTERGAIIDHYYSFLGAVEKRVKLTSGSFEAECLAGVKGLADDVKTKAETAVSEIKSLV